MIRHGKKQHTGGFTVIELLVVLAIFGLVTAIVLFNYSRFSTNVTLQNLAQDVALTVRRAQVFTLGIKTGERVPGQPGEIKGYGVHFDTKDAKSFIIFADKAIGGTPANQSYDPLGGCGSSNTECVERIAIQSTDCLYQLWYSAGGYKYAVPFDNASLSCFKDGGQGGTTGGLGGVPSLQTVTVADISFARPNPDAIFCSWTPCDGSLLYGADWVAIEIASAKGKTKTIYVYPTGLITIGEPL